MIAWPQSCGTEHGFFLVPGTGSPTPGARPSIPPLTVKKVHQYVSTFDTELLSDIESLYVTTPLSWKGSVRSTPESTHVLFKN